MRFRALTLSLLFLAVPACSPGHESAASSASSLPPVEAVAQPTVTQSPAAFSLASPIACVIGKDCFIQQYMDHDPGKPYAFDYTCGHSVYDGHDGTDIRLPDKVAQARGVAVLAAADGVVMGMRDGEPDFDVGAFSAAKVDMDKACGNGVVIANGDGWETQYCHMRRGSVTVKKGQVVKAGVPLGLVGQSGDAAFVHLHFTVRHNKKPVDPFSTATNCSGSEATTLWQAGLRDQMAYRGRQVLNAGFAAAPVSMDTIEAGGIPAPVPSSPALVVYVRGINLTEGDIQTLTLYGPNGAVLASQELPPLDHDKAQYQMFTGVKLTASRWPAGTYRSVYSVTAGSQTVVRKAFSLPLS